MERNDRKAFLGHGWEEIRLRIPRGKYRLVMLDFWDHTAEVLGDFDSLKDAKEYLEDFMDLDNHVDSYTDFVIYNDRGEVVYDAERFSPFPAESGANVKSEIRVPIGEDITIQISDETQYVAVAIFTDSNGDFEDLLFEEAATLEDARKAAEKLRKKHTDADRIIILDRSGNRI